MTDTKHVFVYGTLMRAHGNNKLLRDCGAEFVGEAVTVEPYAMLYAGIPYVVRAENVYPFKENGGGLSQPILSSYPVKGEVWCVGAVHMPRLDNLEGYDPDRPKEQCHYVREEIEVTCGAERLKAFIYFGGRRAAHYIDDPVLPNPQGLLAYPGFHWEDGDDEDDDQDLEHEDDEDEGEVVEPEDQDQGDVEGLHDEREMP